MTQLHDITSQAMEDHLTRSSRGYWLKVAAELVATLPDILQPDNDILQDDLDTIEIDTRHYNRFGHLKSVKAIARTLKRDYRMKTVYSAYSDLNITENQLNQLEIDKANEIDRLAIQECKYKRINTAKRQAEIAEANGIEAIGEYLDQLKIKRLENLSNQWRKRRISGSY